MKQLTLLFLIILGFSLSAQNTFWVSFKNKANSPYSLNNPQEFLSANALARRTYFNLAIEQSDLPLNSSYVQGVLGLDAQIKAKSKWLNAILVQSSLEDFMEQAMALSYVSNVIALNSAELKNAHNKFDLNERELLNTETTDSYGFSLAAMDMLRGRFLHDLGFQGENIDIGVMDNGFRNVDSNRFFIQANLEGRIRGQYNFVDDTSDVFSSGGHGAYVMSTLAAYIEDTLIGTAPKANFYLFTTEDDNAEGLAEEINWALAAEWADSVMGNWIVLSTSLGYSKGFDDKDTDHSYEDMDGNTTIITIAADLAARKGMIVVNSAGNEGDDTWKYITAPADGDSVFAIGAVDLNRESTFFSSYGPSADGRTKPNVSALGLDVIAVNDEGFLRNIAGTSFSCPITAGMAACLWQAFPNKSNMEILQAIERSAHLYYSPEDQMGYGIPNFELAYKILESSLESDKEFILFPNPVKDNLQVWFLKPNSSIYSYTIADANGKIVFRKQNAITPFENKIDCSNLAKGTYYLLIEFGKTKIKEKFLKL